MAAAGSLKIRMVNWDRIVKKYGKAAALAAEKKATEHALIVATDRVQRRLTNHVVTGHLRSGIIWKADGKGSGVVFAERGFGVYYAKFVEEGTGIYGPRKAPIRPKTKKAMMWHPTSVTGNIRTGGSVVRRSVKGQKAVHFMRDTARKDKSRILDAYRTTFAAAFGA